MPMEVLGKGQCLSLEKVNVYPLKRSMSVPGKGQCLSLEKVNVCPWKR